MKGNLPPGMEGIWRSGDYTGDQRPIVRATVQRPSMRLHTFGLASTFTRKRPAPSGLESLSTAPTIDPTRPSRVTQQYADFLFSSASTPRELDNIKSVSWERTVDTDAATCTIELYNVKPLPLGGKPRDKDLDMPGFYTPGHGSSSWSAAWDHARNVFHDLLYPDNIIRTFEGYGFDEKAAPEKDPHLVQTGVWKIDSIKLTTFGTITVSCRDMACLLLEQQAFIPVVPTDFYPLSFKNWDEKIYIGSTQPVPPTQARLRLRAANSSNFPYPSSGGTWGPLHGHKLDHAFDNNPSTWWMSVGNVHPGRGFAYEWVEATVDNQTVADVRFRPIKSGYTAYVSVMVGGKWLGGNKIDYRTEGIGRNGGNISFVASARVSGTGEQRIQLPKPIAKVQRIRLTFGNLQHFPQGPYHYRAGIAELSAYAPPTGGKSSEDIFKGLKVGPAGANPGRYLDYTDIVKLLCAWGGFFWPRNASQKLSNGTTVQMRPKKTDPMLGPNTGRVWGDFQSTGTSGPAEISVDVFDKKPLMDGINHVRDIIGFLFFIDADGGVVWRLPNVYEPGNWIGGASPNAGRTQRVYTIDERQVLISNDAELSSANVRDAIFVGNVLANQGAVVSGFNPNPVGLRRVGGWTDQNFESQAECRVMADMIAVRQMFAYRTGTITIPGFPGIEIDDQVRLMERITSDAYLHYVKGVSMSYSAETGEYTYTLQTHWLGDRTYDRWVFDPNKLSADAKQHLAFLRKETPVPIRRPSLKD